MLTSASLTELYGAPVDVLRVQGRIIVVAATDPSAGHHLSDDDHGASVEPVRPRRSAAVVADRRVDVTSESIWDKIFNFDNYGELLPLLQNSIIAGALLGLIGGLIGVFVMMRDLTFAVHGISELSFAGASFALLVGRRTWWSGRSSARCSRR